MFLLFAVNQFCYAFDVFFTTSIERYYPHTQTIHKVDLFDNTFIKIIDDALLHDVKEDQTGILFSPLPDDNYYSPVELDYPLIIKDFYNYDTLSINGSNAKLILNDSIIIFTSSFIISDTNEWGSTIGFFSSLNIHSIDENITQTLSDSIVFGNYTVSYDENNILWTEKIGADDSLTIFTYDIVQNVMNTLNAKLPPNHTTFISNDIFWAQNNVIYTNLKDTTNVSSLYNLDLAQNPSFFTKIFSFDTTNLFLINTQNFGQEEFLFGRYLETPPNYDYGIYYWDYTEVWTHHINNGTSEVLFDFWSGYYPINYFRSSITSKIYFGSTIPMTSGNFHQYDPSSNILSDLSDTYRYPGYYNKYTPFVYFENNANTIPSDNNLIYPSYDGIVELNQTIMSDSTTFIWSSGSDLEEDSLSYVFNFWNDVEPSNWFVPPTIIFSQNCSDTSITLLNEFLYDIYLETLNNSIPYLRWSVDVTDGLHIINSDYDNAYRVFFAFNDIVSVQNDINPLSYKLHQNYPNPFNPVTTLKYNLPNDDLVNITIYDMIGNVINELVNEVQNSGYKSVQWNAKNNQGQPVSAGVYLYSIEAGDFRQTKKMILLK